MALPRLRRDRKSTRLNSSHTEIYTLSLHDALPIYLGRQLGLAAEMSWLEEMADWTVGASLVNGVAEIATRSEEHTSELQSHRDLHSFPTRRSSDLSRPPAGIGRGNELARRDGGLDGGCVACQWRCRDCD